MSIFVFENISGGGLFGLPGQPPPAGSLLIEGLAMARSLVADLAASSSAPVTQLVDDRVPPSLRPRSAENVNQLSIASRDQLNVALRQQAAACDQTIAIAPESDGILRSTYKTIRDAGGRLLGCDDNLLAWAGDKSATAARLAAAGIQVPNGIQSLGQPQQLPPFPCVVKPNDGAGSVDTVRIDTPTAWSKLRWAPNRTYRIERFCAGQAASIAVLCGPDQRIMLAPCLQSIESANGFAYRGGCVLAAGNLADRIGALGEQVLPVLDSALGYVGIDMVLADASDGSKDVVLEVNPRLTTSYVGLSAACDGNLGQALLDVVAGASTELAFSHLPLQFQADGTVQRNSNPAVV